MPKTLPERVCRTLEAITGLELKTKIPLEDLVYMFCHIASQKCANPHEDWMKEFEKIESEMESAYYTAPIEKNINQKDLTC